MRNAIVFLITVITLCGCAAKLPPKIAIPSDATIGYINLLDAKAKHVHVGTTAFNNFMKTEVSNWDIDIVIKELVKENLANKSNYNLKRLSPTKDFIEQKLELVAPGWDTLKVNPKLVPLLSNLKREHGIDVLVVFNPFDIRVEHNVPVTTNGYGLYTRCVLKKCRALALNNIIVNIFETEPGKLLAWGEAKEYDYKVDINFPSDLNDLSTVEIDKAKPYVFKHLSERFNSAISNAGL